MYLGEYRMRIENGKVKYPFADEKEKIWMITEIVEDGFEIVNYIIINSCEWEKYIFEMKDLDESFRILHKGDFVLDDDVWTVPEIISEHLGTEDIIFVGVIDFVELIPEADFEDMTKLFEDEIEI